MKEKRGERTEGEGRRQWVVRAKQEYRNSMKKQAYLPLSHIATQILVTTLITAALLNSLSRFKKKKKEFSKFQKHQLKQARLHDRKEQNLTPIWNKKNIPSNIWNALMHLTSPPVSQSSLYKYILQMIYCMIQVRLDLQVIVPYCNCFHLKPENSLSIATLVIPMMAHHSTPAAH